MLSGLTYPKTNLATFKAIAKKYPGKPKEADWRDPVASQPSQTGKRFVATRDAGFFALAIELTNRSPADPRTLIWKARGFTGKRPDFAVAAGMTTLTGIMR